MRISFNMFGLAHLAILAMVPIVAAVLAAVQRKLPRGDKAIRFSLAFLLFLCTAFYYGSFVVQGEPMFPGHLPLELCDASLWLIIVALLTLHPVVFDLAYYWAVAGASMALLTPNLVYPSTFLVVQFFADHGLIVVGTLYLVWTRQARPRPGSAVRALLALNVLAAVAGLFDLLFKTNYMFLRAKPPTKSLLDAFGPWPWYLLVCEGFALGLFLLLYVPFRQSRLSNQNPNERLDQVPTSL
jgi:hypothetical integral membrane protein (TIGR02206 family)